MGKKTKKNKIKKTKKTKNKTIKHRNLVIPSSTPVEILKISNQIARKLPNNTPHHPFNLFKRKNFNSYSPTINRELVTLKSIERSELSDCNIKKAYKLKEPLKINVPDGLYDSKCLNYDNTKAKQFLLNNLSANKHVDPTKIIPPIQSQSNCWFNSMFTTFFVSDKGRKFFHFLRQLMIEGKQQNGTKIPRKIRNAFALLNFGIDACLTGNKFAYELDTNSVIKQLYLAIPETYKETNPYIVDVDDAGNPLLYYLSIINYLHNNSLVLLFIRGANNYWKNNVDQAMKKTNHIPHIIVLEVYDNDAKEFNNKPTTFTVNEAKYQIDSTVVRDVSKQHFCSTITCEGEEMGYDGMSFHRIEPLEWKNKLNTDFNWKFEGTNDYDGTPLVWNYTKSYQLLLYYRIQ